MLQKNLDQLEKATSAAKMYRKVCNRLNEVRGKETNEKYNERMKEFLKVVCDLKEKFWKEAATRLKYSTTKLSDEKQKDLKEKFDCYKNMLVICGELFEIILRKVKFMLEHIEVDESKTKIFFDDYNRLNNIHEPIQWNINDMFFGYYDNKFKNDGVGSDFEAIENKLNKLTEKFEDICENSYKTLVEDEYQKFVDRFEGAD